MLRVLAGWLLLVRGLGLVLVLVRGVPVPFLRPPPGLCLLLAALPPVGRGA